MNLIKTNLFRIINMCILLLCCLVVLAACSERDKSAQPQESTPMASETKASQAQPTTGTKPTAASPQPPGSQIDPCALLTQAEIEAALGRPVLAPQKEQVANLATCSYGNPEFPNLRFVTLSVFVGSDAEYYAGAAAQAREAFEAFRHEPVQPVSGLGDDAYWSEVLGRSLHVLRGKYAVELEIPSEAGGLEVAKGLAAKVLERLP